MCVVGRLITRERSREERYCVSHFSDSPHLLISSKSRPNGATKIELAKHTQLRLFFRAALLPSVVLRVLFPTSRSLIVLFCLSCQESV